MNAWFASACGSRRARLLAGAAAAALVWNFCASPAPCPAWAQASRKAPAAPATCATCHAGVAASYAHAPMRHALESAGADPVLDTHPKLSVTLGPYTYTVLTKDGESTYTVSHGTDSMTLPIHWMFGQHTQTWVLEKDGNLYEGLVS